MSVLQIERVPSSSSFKSTPLNSECRDLFATLPSVSELDAASFQKLCGPSETFALKRLPRNLVKELGQLQAVLHATLSSDLEMAIPLALWAQDRKLLEPNVRDVGFANAVDECDRLCHLLGTDRSAWFVQLFGKHLREHSNISSKFDSAVAFWKNDFIDRVSPYIEGGFFPLSTEKLIEKVRDTRFEAVNYFRSPNRICTFDINECKVELATLHFDWFDETDVYHELFHAISGRSVLRFIEGPHDYLVAQRVGLSIDSLAPEWGAPIHFEWFNEGVTETLARMIAPVGKFSEQDQAVQECYDREVALVSTLINVWGISQQAILTAYFQDQQHEAPHGQAYPAWRTLSNEFNRVFGPQALRKLDAYIVQHGIGKALGILKDLKEPDFIFRPIKV